MSKEFFKNLPDTSTPLNASRLNGLLNGNEAMGNIVVGDVKCKNLFNKTAALNGFISTDSTDASLTSDSTTKTSEWIICKPNTYYTIQGGDRRRIQYKNSSGTITYSSYSKDSSDVVTFLTSSDTEFFRVYLVGNINNTSLDDIQIEEGDTATECVTYKKFNCDDLIKLIEVKLTFDTSSASIGDFVEAHTTNDIPIISGMNPVGVIPEMVAYANKNFFTSLNFRDNKVYGQIRIGYKLSSDDSLTGYAYIIYANSKYFDNETLM